MRRIFRQACRDVTLNLIISICFLAMLVLQNKVEVIAFVILEPAVVSEAI